MARVFISYAREDGREFAEFLVAKLEGHDAWFDRRSLAPGVTWNEEIENGIDRCDVFLVVLTRGYRRGEFARLELGRASMKRKAILPLRFHPDADPGIEIQLTQWIDFTNRAEEEQSVQSLLAQVDVLARGGSIAARDLRAGRWDAVQGRTAARSRGIVKDLVREDLYVRRDAAEEQAAVFLAGDNAAMLIVGDSGAGKTSLLCQWTLDLLAQNHAVLLYDCSALAQSDVEEEIARDLGIAEDTALEEMEEVAAQAGKKVFFIFDSIGDYRGPEANGAQALLRGIDKLVHRVHSDRARIVASCNSATWTRLQRGGPITLGRGHYFHSGDDPFLRLGPFSDSERDQAYLVYRKAFDLFPELDDLPPYVRDRLRDPVLLRMTAEVYRGVRQPLLPVNLGVHIYGTFFDKRVTSPAEELLVDQVAAAMVAAKSNALAMTDLAANEELRRELMTDDPRSTYAKLLDCSVLQELRDLRAGFIIRFSHTRVAAYAIAKYFLKRKQTVTESAQELLAQTATFPLAWESAKTLLLVSRDKAAISTLASSRSLEQRELAAEALVELHADDANDAYALLQTLLDQPAEEGRRTALKAAYNIGPQARDFFLRAAIDGAPSMRESVKNTLYLIWRNESPAERRSVTDTYYLLWRRAPGFTYELLNRLLEEIRLKNIKKLKAILEFILDLTITIYINHPENEEVIDKTASLMYDLTVKRLHLNLMTAGQTVDALIIRAFTHIFGGQILEWMMFGDGEPVQAFFRLPAEKRAYLSRIADAFDPAANLAASHDDLRTMLGDEMPIFNGSAAMAIAVHAANDLAGNEPLIRRLWDEGGERERLWILLAFSVLMKATPAEWSALLQDLTRRYVTEHREAFLGPSSRLPGNLDIVLLPLGLAYGKAGSTMPLFEELLADAFEQGDTPLAARIIAGLAAAGFYYPDALFDMLRSAFAQLDDEAIADALVTTLATVRTLHFDAVDRFLNDVDAPEAFRHRVDSAADVALVHRYIRVLGYYNNAVHFTLRYPRMRKPLSAGSLKLLATARTPVAFITDYTLSAMRLMRESHFQLKQWTLPE